MPNMVCPGPAQEAHHLGPCCPCPEAAHLTSTRPDAQHRVSHAAGQRPRAALHPDTPVAAQSFPREVSPAILKRSKLAFHLL